MLAYDHLLEQRRTRLLEAVRGADAGAMGWLAEVLTLAVSHLE